MSGLEETLRAYELNPFGQVDIEVMQRAGGTQTNNNEGWDIGSEVGGCVIDKLGNTTGPTCVEESVARRDTTHTDSAIKSCDENGMVSVGAVSI